MSAKKWQVADNQRKRDTALSRMVAQAIENKHIKANEQVYQSNYTVLAQALEKHSKHYEKAQTILKTLQANALQILWEEATQPSIEDLGWNKRLPEGIKALRVLLDHKVWRFRHKQLHRWFAKAITVIKERLHEPIADRHPDLQQFYETEYKRFRDVQTLELQYIKRYIHYAIEQGHYTNVLKQLINFHSVAHSYEFSDVVMICHAALKRLDAKLHQLPPHLPTDSHCSAPNQLIRLMKYTILFQLWFDVTRELYNHQASYVFNIKTTPPGVKHIREFLMEKLDLNEGRDATTIDPLFDKVLFEITERKYKRPPKRTPLVDAMYDYYEVRMKLIRDAAKFPERFFSDAKPSE